MDDATMLRQATAMLNRMLQEDELTRIKRDPLAFKKTRLMENRANYRYWLAGTNGKGQEVRYCYSTGRNAAGFFLAWRQTHRKNGDVVRDQWASRRRRVAVMDLSRRRYERFRAAKV